MKQLLCFLVCLGIAGWLRAAEVQDGVKIEFVPPPMEGTISLGIYDAEGKLVRVLRREAAVSEFTVALNGLVLFWDGKDDHGATLPPGHYHARGYAVGAVEIEGVDFLGNGWIEEADAPPIRRIEALGWSGSGTLLLQAALVGQSEPSRFAVVETPEVHLVAVPERVEGGFTPALSVTSPDGQRRYELTENGTSQTLAAYRADGANAAALYTKTIATCDRLEAAAPWLTFPDGAPFQSAASVEIPLVPNPLEQDRPGCVVLTATQDAAGSYLATRDGLPLCAISQTPHLRWVAMGRTAENLSMTLFESNGAVVAEFRAAHLERMMAFDAGEWAWPPAAKAPGAAPSPTP